MAELTPGPTRRRMLAGGAGLVAAAALASCSARSGPSPERPTPAGAGPVPAGERHSYGADPSQFVDLYRPATATRPGVVVLIHGGFWLAQYTLSLDAPLAVDLASRGYTAVNIEYRRVGDGGGWPMTFLDVAAAIDSLNRLGLDTGHVVAIGHSAGGQLAAWAAGRDRLPPDAPGAGPRVPVTAVVSQAGVLDLATAARQGVGGSAVPALLGGSPTAVPLRYAEADPIAQVPLRAPVLCVHSRADQNVPFAQSTAYVAAARRAGGSARLAVVTGDHFTLIDPTSAAWATVVAALPGLIAA